jgi:hypothetical protein
LLNLQFHNTSKVAAKFSANFGRRSEIKTKGFLAFIATASLQISTFVVKQQFHLPAAIFHHSVRSKPKLKISAEVVWCRGASRITAVISTVEVRLGLQLSSPTCDTKILTVNVLSRKMSVGANSADVFF